MKRIIRLVIMIIAISLALVLYYNFYSIESKADAAAAISDELSKHVEIIEIIEFKKDKLVLFRTDSMIGYIPMSKGLNGKYNLESGFMDLESSNLHFFDYRYEGKDYVVLAGRMPDRNVKIMTVKGERDFLSDETFVFEVLDLDVTVIAIKSYIYESNQMNMTVELDNEIEFMNYEGVINNGPRNLVLVSSFLVVLAGFIVSLMFTPGINKLEELYFKRTKSYPAEYEKEDEFGNLRRP